MDEWLSDLAHIAEQEGLWSAGDTIVVAISGGPDSTALLHMLHRLAPSEQIRLVAAHVNHGFRPEESAREAEAVRQLADELGIVYESIILDMPAYIEETGMNAQAAAREKRFAFLHEVAQKHGANRVALAHHADDQAETVLMRILRGTSPSGLSGIAMKRKEKNVELIRPLLRRNKADILSYCEHFGISFIEDSSNAKRTYLRNKIRLDVLPYLSTFNPQLSQSLVRLADLAAAEDDWIEQETKASFGRHIMLVSQGCQMTRKAMLDLHVALQRRLIKLILNYVGMETETISFDSVETIRLAAYDSAASTWSLDVGSGIRFVREYDMLYFLRPEKSNSSTISEEGYNYVVTDGVTRLEVLEAEAELLFEVLQPTVAYKPTSKQEALFDTDKLAFPLSVRNRHHGDRMQVLGLNGTKKVQDMFVDDRIAPSRREKMPLLVDSSGNILWIPGVRRSGIAQINASTKHILRVRAVFTSTNDFD
ncbi:tRNA(Ile)-lysidine synthase [Paenibacillus baekrokdamisoli]|uniref:tRNA(Ile)-lysidine synthase n=1 Tax=Paenibacillus baekrokdamisoli TaxID=1712516 RepID=A0A3G9JH00_9BACL|nr:tRNA lysidine(34) synthetase TilS [Paenibacillus baekrokdamisoli]MBB3073006.1 tRNA(Ile)-lysidine synthase [Paenibacillus baekrokdamisoli]BBH23328.1 tRNA(Ile)-lysidine synthase [Paenibacillus baekrokdamisoli]